MITWELGSKITHVNVETRKDGSVNVNVGSMNPSASSEHRIIVRAHLNSVQMQVALSHTMEALRHYFPCALFLLDLPYVPYARQDRRCNPGEAVGIKVFADYINQLNFSAVMITDPHSLVTPALINNCQVYSAETWIGHLNWADYIIVAPDLGALKKAEEFAKYVGAQGVIAFHKVRDMATGDIISHKMVNSSGVNLVAKDKFLVLDDICDGGRTFVGVAEQLREILPKPIRLELAVTHGIFSYGVEVVTDVYDMVHTTDSFLPNRESSNKLKVHNIH